MNLIITSFIDLTFSSRLIETVEHNICHHYSLACNLLSKLSIQVWENFKSVSLVRSHLTHRPLYRRWSKSSITAWISRKIVHFYQTRSICGIVPVAGPHLWRHKCGMDLFWKSNLFPPGYVFTSLAAKNNFWVIQGGWISFFVISSSAPGSTLLLHLYQI